MLLILQAKSENRQLPQHISKESVRLHSMEESSQRGAAAGEKGGGGRRRAVLTCGSPSDCNFSSCHGKPGIKNLGRDVAGSSDRGRVVGETRTGKGTREVGARVGDKGDGRCKVGGVDGVY